MIDLDAMERFDRLRQRTMQAIAYELSLDGCCKSYEGILYVGRSDISRRSPKSGGGDRFVD